MLGKEVLIREIEKYDVIYKQLTSQMLGNTSTEEHTPGGRGY